MLYITGKRIVKDKGKWVEKKIRNPHPVIYKEFGCDDKRVRDYVKKMMGRIMFLCFLEKKGWLGVSPDNDWGCGDKDFLMHLYQKATDNQKDNKEVTEAKRYTFLLGPGQSCRTAADNFQKLIDKRGEISREDIVKAFDVEALSDEFFKKYKSQYEQFVRVSSLSFQKRTGLALFEMLI